ncbi:MAG: pilus assembly protein PilP [Desulfobacteraceae bacterium]|nr:pilus assembly protein PilP [Desulfobacteraceae bacterium]
MSKRTLFIAALFFLLSPWFLMGLGSSPEEPEKDVHVSEEVRIDQQQEKAQEDRAASAETKEQEKSGEKTSRSQAAQEAEPEKQAESGEGQQAQDTDDSKKSAEQELREMTLSGDESLMGDEQRLYTRKGRVDPFEPFLNKQSEETASGGEGEEIDQPPPGPLTRVSLSQLKLTAILQIPGEKKSMAMVEDPSGKGFVIHKGTYVGESGGKVSEILSDRILIREKYKDVYGKIAVREIEKKLQK